CCLIAFLVTPPSLCVPTDSSESDLELSTVRHQPEGLEQLQAQTKFTKKELQSLYRGFKNVSHPLLAPPILTTALSPTPPLPETPSSPPTRYWQSLYRELGTDRLCLLCSETSSLGVSETRHSPGQPLEQPLDSYSMCVKPVLSLQEMLAIMKSIYDMMGRYTYPCVRDDAPFEHVEKFFQKMDRNRDGVVTIDEFMETCQKDENIMNSMQLFENVI
uniref:Kv channel interacting protein 3b, calsenilin n=1 Tax=Lepisosteus oculatus TaxID=7918 RepID=W5NF41_LEPOC